ncbi:hypothetical protein MANI_001962 [Metarhizium anisopliae]|nr:hypothetical protein MANI_001962 [Metarhizium anisopliae]
MRPIHLPYQSHGQEEDKIAAQLEFWCFILFDTHHGLVSDYTILEAEAKGAKAHVQLQGGLGPRQPQQTPSSSGSKLARSSLPPEAITDSPSTDSNAALNASANGASNASDISDRPGKASSERLWSQADQDLCGRAEPGLMDEFEAQLGGQPLSNPKSVKEAVIQRLSERQDKKWHFTLMGKTHTVRDQAQRLVDLLTFSDSIVKLAPLNAASAQNQALVDGFEAVVVVQRYWATCENVFLSESQQHISRELATKLQNLYSLMLEYQVRAICHLSKGAIKRALKSPENDWGKKLNAIRDCDVTCRNLNDVLWREEARDSQSVQFRKMDEHRDLQLKALQAAADERQNVKVNNFLRGLTAAAGQYKRGKNINPTRVPGTCEWFVSNEDFCEWRDSQSSNLLWVSAAPGCGKSVLSRTLIDEDYLVTDLTVEVDPSGVYTLRGTSSPVCYFFFKHGDKSREKMTSSLCAILHQLLLSHGTEDLLDRAAEKYACQPTMLEDASEMWKIIEEYVNSWDTGDIICVLDALDECNRESRDEFIQILHDFFGGEQKPGQPRLKLLITSRPEYDLRLSFDSFPNSIYLHFDKDGRLETAKTLLAFGASVNGSGDEAVMTPLYSAINGNHRQMIPYRGRYEIACMLVDAGANSGDIGRALHIAAGCGYYRITRMLLTAGADVNVRCGYRHQLNTPLYEATVNGHEKVAQLLLSKGGDVLITEGTLAWIDCDEIISKFVHDKVGNAVPVTPHLILAVARNKKGGDQIMSVILDKRGGDVRITEEVIESLLENSYAGYDLMNVLVQQHADDSQTTASLVQKEWRSHLRYEQVQPFLKQHPITRRMMMAGKG